FVALTGTAGAQLPGDVVGIDLLTPSFPDGEPTPERFASFPDVYGGWPMWWSANREEFFGASAAESRPAGAPAPKPLTDDIVRGRVIPALLAALKDDDRQVRDAAAIALGGCGGAEEVPALVQALSDKDREAAEGALIGLGII